MTVILSSYRRGINNEPNFVADFEWTCDACGAEFNTVSQDYKFSADSLRRRNAYVSYGNDGTYLCAKCTTEAVRLVISNKKPLE